MSHEIESTISNLIEQQFPEFYQEEGDRIAGTKERVTELEKEIAGDYERWEFLEAIVNSEMAWYNSFFTGRLLFVTSFSASLPVHAGAVFY